MQQRTMWRSLLAALVLLTTTSPVLPQRKKKNEEPRTQVLPLPPNIPMAIAADTGTLDFHISSLLTAGGLSTQIRRSLNDLIRDTRGETIIKLRAFVAGAGDARRVASEVGAIFSERKLPFPVLTILQVGGLGTSTAQVVIEAVVDTHKTINPNGLAFLAGQNGTTLTAAVERVKASAAAASVQPGDVLSTTCFTGRIDNAGAMRSIVQSAFPKTAINIVQAVRDPGSEGASCEAVGQLSKPSAEGELVWLRDSRVALVSSKKLILTGLQLSFGNYLDDAQEAFARLQRAAATIQAVQSPVQVNAFPLDASAGSALRKKTTVPPNVFTVQTIEGLPAIDASAGIEAVLAPNVASPATIAR
jgi:hypothetical protein